MGRTGVRLISCVLAIGLAVGVSLDAHAQPPADAPVFWLWRFLGRMHPMVVHFPITLVFLVVLFGGIDRLRGTSAFRSTTGILIWAAAIASFVSSGLGLLLANTEDYAVDTLPGISGRAWRPRWWWAWPPICTAGVRRTWPGWCRSSGWWG